MDEDFLQTFMLAIVSGCFDNVDNFDDELEEILTALLSAGNAGESSDFFEEVVPDMDDYWFMRHFRLNREAVSMLLEDLELQGEEKFNAIDLDKKLHLFLWYAANTETFRQISSKFGLAESSACRIVHEMMVRIANLANNYIKWPDAVRRDEIIERFRFLSGIDGAVGCLDGTHFKITKPSGEDVDPQPYFNGRKNFYSQQLQAVCDDCMRFTDVYAGWFGSAHDSRVLRNSRLFADAQNHYAVS